MGLRVWLLVLVLVTVAACSLHAETPSLSPGAATPSRTAPRIGGNLLYVANAKGSGTQALGFVSIFALPQGKAVAQISGIGYPTGLCADAAANVWVVAVERGAWHAYKYAHGATTPIAKIRIRDPNYASGCAVDPASGDLAIFTGVEGYGVKKPAAEIWPGARDVKPTRHLLSFTPVAGAYDASGNLFVDGYIGGTSLFDFAELANGRKSFTNVTVDKHAEWPGGVQWDGTYIALETGGLGRRAVIYRITVAAGSATVVSTIRPRGLYFDSSFCVESGMIAAMTGMRGNKVALWAYPAGGVPSRVVSRFQDSPRAVAISLADP